MVCSTAQQRVEHRKQQIMQNTSNRSDIRKKQKKELPVSWFPTSCRKSTEHSLDTTPFGHRLTMVVAGITVARHSVSPPPRVK